MASVFDWLKERFKQGQYQAPQNTSKVADFVKQRIDQGRYRAPKNSNIQNVAKAGEMMGFKPLTDKLAGAIAPAFLKQDELQYVDELNPNRANKVSPLKEYGQIAAGLANVYLAGRAAPIGEGFITKGATALNKFGRASLVRGLEGAGYGALQGFADGKDNKDVLKNAGYGALFGVGTNALLSPKLTKEAGKQFLRTQLVTDTLDAPIRNFDTVIDKGVKINTVRQDLIPYEVSNADYEHYINTGKFPDVKINDYQNPGTTRVWVNGKGEIESWTTDNPDFAKKVMNKKFTMGLSTRNIKPSEAGDGLDALSNEARKIEKELTPLQTKIDKGRKTSDPSNMQAYRFGDFNFLTPADREKYLSLNQRLADIKETIRGDAQARIAIKKELSSKGIKYDPDEPMESLKSKLNTGGIIRKKVTQKQLDTINREYDEYVQRMRSSSNYEPMSYDRYMKFRGMENYELIPSQPLSTTPKTTKPIKTEPRALMQARGIKSVDAVEFEDGIKKAQSIKQSLPEQTIATRQSVSLPGQTLLDEITPQSQSMALKPLTVSPGLKTQVDQIDNVKSSFADIIDRNYTNVKDKVGLLDYVRTPDRVLKKIGLENESKFLRKQYDAYQKQLPEEIDKISQWASQVDQTGNVKIFKFLDGQIGSAELNPNELKVANEVKDYLKNWADRLDLPEDKRISNYITHIFDKDLQGTEFPDDIAKIITDQVAGSVYDPFTQQRLGKLGYVEDTFRALEAYVKRATRKANLDPALEQIKKSAEKLEKSQFDYVKQYIDRVNMRPTNIDTLIDNTIKSIPGVGYKLGQRPTASLSRAGRQMVYRGTLGLNVSSALKNLSQGANTYAKLGEKYTAKGYFDLVKNWKSDELQKVGVLRDDFIQDKNINFYKKTLDKMDKGLFYLFETAEKINRGSAYYGAKAKALAQGLPESEAIDYAKKIVRDTQFTFGSIDTPPILQSDIGKTIGQFQSFSLKQAEFLTEMAKNKEWAGMARWLGASLLFVYGVGEMFGMEPKDLIPSFRFGVPPVLDTAWTGIKALTGGTGEYGQKIELKDVAKSGVKFIPGGVQLKKTYEGLKTVGQGYSETDKGLIRFPIKQDTPNKVKSLLFGQYSTPEARDYFRTGKKSLSDNQSEIFKQGGGQDYYNQVMNRREADKQAKKEIEQAKKGKQVKNNLTSNFGDDIIPLSTGEFYSKSADKTFKTEGDVKIYQFEKQNGTDKRSSADWQLAKQRTTRAKDYKTYVEEGAKRLQYLEKYIALLDPNSDEYVSKINQYEDLLYDLEKKSKYGSGSSAKGKAPKKISQSLLNIAKPKTVSIKTVNIPKVSVPKLSLKQFTTEKANAKFSKLKLASGGTKRGRKIRALPKRRSIPGTV